MYKRLLVILLVFTLAITGCTNNQSKEEKENKAIENQSSKINYHYVESNVLGEGEKIIKASSNNDELVYIQENKEKEGDYLVVAVNKNDEKRQVNLSLNGVPESVYFTDNYLYVILSHKSGARLAVFDLEGKKKDTIVLSEASGNEEDEIMYFGGQKIVHADDKRVIVSDSNGLVTYDLTSKKKQSLFEESFSYTSVSNGKLYGLVNGKTTKMIVYDLSSDQEVKRLDLPKGIYLTSLDVTDNGFLGIDYEYNIYEFDKTMKLVSKANLSDIGPKRFMKNTSMNDTFYWNGKVYYSIMFDESIIDMTSGDTQVAFNGATLFAMERKEGENPANVGMKEIVIYTHQSDYMLNLYAKEFMGKNDNIKITIQSFDDLSKADYIKKMNTDLIAGKPIDLVNLNDVPADKLVKKNFFENLSKHLSKKDEESFYPSVLSGIKYNDVIYGLPISFSTQGIYMNKSIMNEAAKAYQEHPTFENFNKMLASYKDTDAKIFRKLTDEEIIKVLLDNNLKGLVDTKSTRPISKEQLNVFLDTLKDIRDNHMNKDMGRDEYIYYGTKDKILAEVSENVESFSLSYVKALLAKDYTLVPYPSKEGTGFSGVGMVYGIPAASASKDEAISFLKFLSTNEKVQDSLSFMGLTSVNKGSLDRYLAKQKNENEGTAVVMMGMPEQTKYGDKLIDMVDNTDEDYQIMSNAYKMTNNIEVYNSNVKQIIKTEILNHLKVDSTRDELLGTLNNKLFLYYNE